MCNCGALLCMWGYPSGRTNPLNYRLPRGANRDYVREMDSPM